MPAREPSPPVPRPWWLGLALRLGGAALVLVVLDGFRRFDWGQGTIRAGLLAMLVGGALLLVRLGPGQRLGWTTPPSWVAAGLWAVTACIAVVVVWQGLAAFQQARQGRTIAFDQAQFIHRAVRMLGKGGNPYGREVVLDTTEYPQAMAALRRGPCFVSGPRAELGLLIAEGFARDFSPNRFNGLRPKIADRPGCTVAALRAESFGLKYGPAVVAAHFPFVLLWDQAGVLVTQLLFLAGLCVFLAALATRASPRAPACAAIPAAVFLLFAPHSAFAAPATDLIPTALALAAWWLVEAKREARAGACLALACAAKLAPAVFYLPLLLRCGRRGRLAFALTLAVVLGPFLLWDARGLGTNLVLFSFLRDSDSTALSHGWSTWARVALQVAGAALVLMAFVWSRRRRHDFRGLLALLLVVHGAALATGGNFHNNYLVWLVPLVGLALLAGLEPASPSVRARTGIGGQADTGSSAGAILDGERVARS